MKVLQCDPRAAQAFGAAGRNPVREFTVSAVIERVEQMYVSAIAETTVKVPSVG
jgi:hypothetical protein